MATCTLANGWAMWRLQDEQCEWGTALALTCSGQDEVRKPADTLQPTGGPLGWGLRGRPAAKTTPNRLSAADQGGGN